MEDVTDTVFRQIVLECAAPDRLHVVFTEFTSTDGLCHPQGQAKVAQRLLVNESERRLLRERGIKLVVQIWGRRPEKFREAVRLLRAEHDFDGIDINMGCPVKDVVRQGCCAALIDDPSLAKEIVLAAREEADCPVSVKTRTGVRQAVTESWIEHLLAAGPAAIILHGRTQREMSRRPADWDEIAKAVRVRDAWREAACGTRARTPILGNGDVDSLADARARAARSGVDGVMIGRGIFHDPWFFNDGRCAPEREERLRLLWRHTRLFAETWGDRKQLKILRKFYKIYASGFPGASELRARLMAAESPAQVAGLLGVNPETLP